MKILIDARFWRKETGGIGRYSRELLKELLALNTDDQFHVLIHTLDEPEFAVKDQRVAKHVTDIGHYTLSEQLKLPGLIKAINPDLVHFLNFNQPVLGIGAPRVTTIHDLTVRYFPVGRSQRSWLRRFAFNQVMKHAAHSDAVIAISRATKIDVVRDLAPDPSNVHVIYEAADERFRPYPKKAIEEFRVRSGRTTPYILFVNQWRPHKGLPELIAAFGKLKKAGLPHQLVLAGKPNKHFPDLAEAIEASPYRDDIIRPGFIPDEELPLYYAAAAVYAFPSYYEGFGLGLLEAMGCGTPVACTKISSIPEVVGEAGLYVPPKDAKALAAALKRVLTDEKLAAELSKKSLGQVKQFSWAKMARETYAVYEQIFQAQRSPR